MKRTLSIAALLMIAMAASASDRYTRDPDQVSIATTGRVLKVDLKNKSFRVRGADAQSIRSAPDIKPSLWQRIGITIALPGRSIKVPTKPSPSNTLNSLNEYTVITTSDTVFQDGADTLRFEDFRAGETISIHGVLTGGILTASRIAKWD